MDCELRQHTRRRSGSLIIVIKLIVPSLVPVQITMLAQAHLQASVSHNKVDLIGSVADDQCGLLPQLVLTLGPEQSIPFRPRPVSSERELDGSAPGALIARRAGDQSDVAGCHLQQFDILRVKGIADPAEDIETIAAETGAQVGQRIAFNLGVDRR